MNSIQPHQETYPLHRLVVTAEYPFNTTFGTHGREYAAFDASTPEGLFHGHLAAALFSEGADKLRAAYSRRGERFAPEPEVDYANPQGLILSVRNNGPTIHSFILRGEQVWWDEALKAVEDASELDVVACATKRIIAHQQSLRHGETPLSEAV